MEIFSNTSQNFIKLITDFQNKKISNEDFNKNLLVNTIFTHFYFNKQQKKDNKIKETQNKTYQSFFILEYKTEQTEKQLFANIRDRKGKKMVEESIRTNKDNLIRDLSCKKDMNIFVEQTYNTYLPPKNISLSMNFQSNMNNNYNKKYIPDTNLEIQYINPSQNQKESRTIKYDFIEPPFFPDFSNDLDEKLSQENDEDIKDSKAETIEITSNTENNNTNLNLNDSLKKDENDEFMNLIEEDDDILFYEEKLKPDEDLKKLSEWNKNIKNNDMISDFQYLRQKNKILTEQVNELYYTLQQDKIIKNEMSSYLKNSEIMYEKISQQNHYHEFAGYLSEKLYKSYLKKMNYNYLIFMLLQFFDFEDLVKSYTDIIDETRTMMLFVKKIILFVGISNTKVYDPIVRYIENKKGKFSFEDFLNCFMPIFDLPEKYQYYKYGFLLFLAKKKGENIITLSNYRIFCNMIRGKLIYEEDICEDIIGKLIPIIKTKYPKDDTTNLIYRHVTIILEFLVDYMYGG